MSPPEEIHHVLMVSLAAQGHLNPMLRLAKRLHNKGINVTLATPEISRHRALTRSATSSKNEGINLEFFSDGLALESDRSDMDRYFRTLARFGPGNLAGLIRDIPKVTCIINNLFVPWVVDVAQEIGIPCAMLWIQPCSLFSLYYRFYNKIAPFEGTRRDEIVTVDVPGLPLLHTTDLPSFILPSNTLESIDDVLTHALRPNKKANWVLANSFERLESEPIRFMSDLVPIKPVGPLVDVDEDDVGFDMWKADESCIEWLNEQGARSVVYVSFGSLLNLPGKTNESIATALKKTKMPFLWVRKASEIGGAGAGADADTVVDELGGTLGKVVTWCPQNRVLRHPAVGCFLTHCGWNSVLEALTAGMPLVCFPQWTDQPTNAKLVEEVFGVGLRVWPNKEGGVDVEEVQRCIEDVMVGPDAEKIKVKSAEWRKAAREAVADGGSSDLNIQSFIDEFVKLSSAS